MVKGIDRRDAVLAVYINAQLPHNSQMNHDKFGTIFINKILFITPASSLLSLKHHQSYKMMVAFRTLMMLRCKERNRSTIIFCTCIVKVFKFQQYLHFQWSTFTFFRAHLYIKCFYRISEFLYFSFSN